MIDFYLCYGCGESILPTAYACSVLNKMRVANWEGLLVRIQPPLDLLHEQTVNASIQAENFYPDLLFLCARYRGDSILVQPLPLTLRVNICLVARSVNPSQNQLTPQQVVFEQIGTLYPSLKQMQQLHTPKEWRRLYPSLKALEPFVSPQEWQELTPFLSPKERKTGMEEPSLPMIPKVGQRVYCVSSGELEYFWTPFNPLQEARFRFRAGLAPHFRNNGAFLIEGELQDVEGVQEVAETWVLDREGFAAEGEGMVEYVIPQPQKHIKILHIYPLLTPI